MVDLSLARGYAVDAGLIFSLVCAPVAARWGCRVVLVPVAGGAALAGIVAMGGNHLALVASAALALVIRVITPAFAASRYEVRMASGLGVVLALREGILVTGLATTLVLPNGQSAVNATVAIVMTLAMVSLLAVRESRQPAADLRA